MIRGVVQDFQAKIHLAIRGTDRRYESIPMLVDTGFDGWLSLPPALIARLGLPVVGDGQGLLADGGTSHFDVFAATIRWHGRTRPVPVYAISPIPLVGMALLDGNEFNVKAREGGPVTITPLRQRRHS